MEEIIVKESEAGVRLDQFITSKVEGISRAKIQHLLKEEYILLNGKPTVKNYRVEKGDRITLNFSKDSILYKTKPLPEDIKIEIIYEDENIIAVNKPAGLVVHPGKGNYSGTLVNALTFKTDKLSDISGEDRPGIVHRLDKETSGVLLIAKDNRTHFKLASDFANRRIEKEYIGICIGHPKSERGLIEKSIERSRSEPTKKIVSNTGKEALTIYELIEYRSGISVLRFFPKTGRTHQIRVHCSSCGFPIIGDVVYGGGKDRIMRIDPLHRAFAYKVYKCFSRHALHAYRIRFLHPVKETMLTIESPLPDDFRKALLLFGGILNSI